jgi:hypothetical protein
LLADRFELILVSLHPSAFDGLRVIIKLDFVVLLGPLEETALRGPGDTEELAGRLLSLIQSRLS